MTQQILEFYEKFSNYESVGNSAFIDRGNQFNRTMRQIKAAEILLSDNEIIVRVDHKMSSYIKNKLSPVVKAKENNSLVDTNKLLLSIAITRIFFEEKEENIYFPLISIDLTDIKDEIFSAIRNGIYDIHIPWDSKIVINESIISTLYDISYEENGEKKLEFIGETLSDLIPENKRTLNDFTSFIYDNFKSNEATKLDLAYPSFNSEKSVLFMFFNQKDEVKLRREYSKIKKDVKPLLSDYLTYTQKTNEAPKMRKDRIWLGSLTKEFPLGHGQGIVMQRNDLNDKIIPVVGGPGTGKTTLFLSLIASEVTKRALTIAKEDDDYNNMILITSTANKAVDNVSSDLKKGFKHGFCYIGGNQKNKEISAEEVKNYISFLNKLNYSSEKQEFHKNKILRYEKIFSEKREIFNKIKLMNLTFKSVNDLNDFMSKSSIHATSFSNSQFFKLEKFGISIEKAIEIINHEKYEYFLNELKPNSIFSRIGGIFKKNDVIAEISIELSIKKEFVFEVFEILLKTSEQDLLNFIENKVIENVKLAKKLTEGKEKFLDGILKYDSFSEYFRTNLFKMNYDLYISSLNFMNQEILKHKDSVIKSVKYLIADNQYEYILNNYGYSKEKQEEFLRFISLAYPVVTSTLAAANGMFSTIKVNPFNTIMADEAGMIASHSMAPVMNRANRAIIVGDPKQLEPIVQINDIFLSDLKRSVSEDFWETYSPTLTSAFHRAAGTVEGGFRATGRGIVLDEHRRCIAKIANLFIDIAEYKDLKVCTYTKKTKQLELISENLWFFNVKNSNTESYVKVNRDEILKIEAILNRLESIGYDLKNDVGIITPYKDQERELINSFGLKLNHIEGGEAKIGTVHKFQGVEYKVIIFSTVVSRNHDSLSFININPSMINVAVSRAKEVFMVVGDYEKLTEDSSYSNYAGRMSRHIELNGRLVGNISTAA